MIRYWALFVLLIVCSQLNAQAVYKVKNEFVGIKSEIHIGDVNDKVILQRRIDGEFVDIALVRIAKIDGYRFVAKIVKTYGDYSVAIGDVVKELQNENIVNELDEQTMTALLQQSPVQDSFVENAGETSEVRTVESIALKKPELIHPKYRIGINLGFGYRTAGISDEIQEPLKSYVKGLKSGTDISVRGAYFFSNMYGIGFDYLVFKSSNQLNNLAIYDVDTGEFLGFSSMEDKITITLAGPSFWERFYFAKNKGIAIVNVAVGPLFYSDNSNVVGTPVVIEGTSVGFGALFGLDFMVNENIALGISISTVGGAMNSFQVNGEKMKLGEPENVGRINFDAGVRFYF